MCALAAALSNCALAATKEVSNSFQEINVLQSKSKT